MKFKEIKGKTPICEIRNKTENHSVTFIISSLAKMAKTFHILFLLFTLKIQNIPHILFYCLFIYLFRVFFFETEFVYFLSSTSCSWTCSVDEAGLKLRDPPVSAQVMALKVCAISIVAETWCARVEGDTSGLYSLRGKG